MADLEQVRSKGRKAIRVSVIAAFGLLVTTGALLYGNFFLWMPIGSGPAGPPVSPQYFQSAWTDRSIVVLGVGDSITAALERKPVIRSSRDW